MDPYLQAMLLVAGVGGLSALLLVGIVALRLRVERRSFLDLATGSQARPSRIHA